MCKMKKTSIDNFFFFFFPLGFSEAYFVIWWKPLRKSLSSQLIFTQNPICGNYGMGKKIPNLGETYIQSTFW